MFPGMYSFQLTDSAPLPLVETSEMAESNSDNQELEDSKDTCRKVKKKVISKSKKKSGKELKSMIALLTKLDMAGQAVNSRQTNPISLLNEVCMKNNWQFPKYSKCQDTPTQVKCVFLDRVVIGCGANKKAAKQDAAFKVLAILET